MSTHQCPCIDWMTTPRFDYDLDSLGWRVGLPRVGIPPFINFFETFEPSLGKRCQGPPPFLFVNWIWKLMGLLWAIQIHLSRESLLVLWWLDWPLDYWILAYGRIRLCGKYEFLLDFRDKWLRDEYLSGDNWILCIWLSIWNIHDDCKFNDALSFYQN